MPAPAKTKQIRQRTPRAKSDSHPLVFSTLDLTELSQGQDKWLSQTSPLDFINVTVVRQCLTEATRGAFAKIQWLWEKLEPADSYLATCVERREGALSRIPWRLVKKDGLTDIEDSIADAQLRTLQDFVNAIENMDEAIKQFGQASFRQFKRIQMVEESNSFKLVPTDNWNWCRDGFDGDWGWNPKASYGLTKSTELPVPDECLLTRTTPRPIDQVGMMLCLDRKNAKAQWMTFNGRYGVPPFFVVLPQGISEATKNAYIKMALQCISNSAGVLPPGADVKTVAVQTGGPDTFKGIIEMSNQEMVLRATGGLMTMLTAPGAGTTEETGNTHQKAFDDLAAAEADSIAGVINKGMILPLLKQWHPGQRQLVELEIKHPEADDKQTNIDNLVRLSQGGFSVDPDEASEMAGVKLTAGTGIDSSTLYAIRAAGYSPQLRPLQERVGMPLQPAINDMNNALVRYLPLMKWPAAREAFTRSINTKTDILRQINQRIEADRKPLTPDEMALFKQLSTPPTNSELAELAETLKKPLQAAEQSQTPIDSSNTQTPIANPLQMPNSGSNEPPTPSTTLPS